MKKVRIIKEIETCSECPYLHHAAADESDGAFQVCRKTSVKMNYAQSHIPSICPLEDA